MGKKTKKIRDSEDLLSNAVKQELENDNFDFESNSVSDCVKSKKKNRKRNLNGTIIDDIPVQINDGSTSDHTATKIKRDKKKKSTKLNDQELSEKDQNNTNTNKLDDDVRKKKKKKSKVLDEHNLDINQASVATEVTEVQKDSKKKKKKDSLLKKPNLEDEEEPKIQNDKKQNKKGKKSKTGAPVLNDEEAQVTEEDIDKFIDELDEEDNKQYEDWVKLLDARLSKKQRTE